MSSIRSSSWNKGDILQREGEGQVWKRGEKKEGGMGGEARAVDPVNIYNFSLEQSIM